MENNFLPHFINETVYSIKGDVTPNVEKPDMNSETPPVESNKKVEIADQKQEVAVSKEVVPQKADLKFKGSNQRKVLIIVDYADHEYIAPEDEEFLSKVLQAVNISMTEVALLNLVSNSDFDYADALKFEAAHILYFGKNKILPSQFTNYSIQSVSNRQVLLSPSLAQIAAATSEKKLLWGALKQMF